MTTRTRDFKISRNSSSKVIVGNVGLNSKTILSVIRLVLSWRVTIYGAVVNSLCLNADFSPRQR